MAAVAINSGSQSTGNISSGTSLVISHTPGGTNPVTIVRVIGPVAPSSVVFAGTGPQFKLIKNVVMGTITISFWGAFLPQQSANNVTITFPSSTFAFAQITTYINAYQTALPSAIYTNYQSYISTITLTIPDVDNLAAFSGIEFGQRVQGFTQSSITGSETTLGNFNGYNFCSFTITSPTAPYTVTINNGTPVQTGIAVLVIEEFGWVAPNPLSYSVCPYFSGGFARKMVSTINNLWPLNNQAVSISQDGNVSVDSGQIVTNGVITLTNKGAVVNIGLPNKWTVQLLPLGGDGQTINQGKERKMYDIVLRVYNSLGGAFGANSNNLFNLPIPVVTQTKNKISNPLYTGDIHGVGFESKWDTYCMPVLTGSQPLPFTLLATIIRSEISEDK